MFWTLHTSSWWSKENINTYQYINIPILQYYHHTINIHQLLRSSNLLLFSKASGWDALEAPSQKAADHCPVSNRPVLCACARPAWCVPGLRGEIPGWSKHFWGVLNSVGWGLQKCTNNQKAFSQLFDPYPCTIVWFASVFTQKGDAGDPVIPKSLASTTLSSDKIWYHSPLETPCSTKSQCSVQNI